MNADIKKAVCYVPKAQKKITRKAQKKGKSMVVDPAQKLIRKVPVAGELLYKGTELPGKAVAMVQKQRDRYGPCK